MSVVRRASPTPRYIRPRGLGWPTTVVFGLMTLAFAVTPTDVGGSGIPAHPVAAITVGAALAAIVFRERFCRTATVVAIVSAALGIATGGPTFAFLPAVLLTVFTTAVLTDRITTAVAVVIASSVAGEVATGVLPHFFRDSRVVILWVVLTVLAAMTGDAARSRAAYIEGVQERARRAEANLEAEAQRRVVEERLRLARDLHDAVAHHIAVINLQAAAARRALPEGADASARSLDTVTDAARTVLADMGNMLYVLRQGDAQGGGQAPLAGLEEVPALLRVFAADGLRVELVETGARVALDQPVDIVAYRCIQEGLTNAHKHGAGGTAVLRLDWGEGAVEVEVENGTAAPAPDAPPLPDAPDRHRYGLAGVRERVASVGGTLELAETIGRSFVFRLRLPLQTPASRRSAP